MTTRRRPRLMGDIAVGAGSIVLIGLLWTAVPTRFAILGAVAVLLVSPGYIAWRTSPSVRTGDGPDSRPFVSAGPPPRAAFRGRGRELDRLREHYRTLRTPNAANGPIILAVHGMPGVGKSALAVELARSLADDFPDGQLYANLGNAGRIRAEADILYRFLRSLGVPPSEIPTSTVDRSAYFRSATADKRMLVILDAARDHDQVARLMPAGDACAVIVTSRRDLGGAMGVLSMRLRVPDLDEALEILWSVSNTRFGEDQKFAIELVQRVGHLPLAIRAVGDMMVQQMEGLADVARTLRDPAALERVLRSYGRGVEDRFDSEYGRLTAIEQRALRLLSLIDTPSFVPWILIPLLGHDVRDYAEVEKLISRLSERQLLEPAGVDEVTGLDRYTFHPLVRMFAERRREAARDDEAGDDLGAARDRVDEAYLEAAERVLAGLDPAYRDSMPTQRPPRWYPVETAISGQIASLPGRWVRSEYANLVRGVQAAQASSQWHVAWRIAARLGDCAPHAVDRRQVRDVFEIGLKAAEDDGDPFGTIEVLLAQGGWLSRVGDLSDAYDSLNRAAHLANTSRHRLAPLSAGPLGDNRATLRKAYRLECEAHRRIAEAQLSIGAYRDAGSEIRRAVRLADLAGDERQRVLLRLMHCHVAHDHPDTIPAGDREDEETLFWRELAAAEHELRHRRFGEASERLRKLRHEYEDDTARVATLLMRIAALRLEQINLGSGDAQHLMGRGLHRAAEAVNRFQLVGDVAGEIRARSILLRALVSLDFPKPAKIQLETIGDRVPEVDPAVWHDRSPLWAAVARAEGELMLSEEDVANGRARLARAAAVFRAHGDHLAEDGIRRAHLFGELPHDAFDDGPAGRRASAQVMATAPVGVGQTFTVAYSLGAAALVDDRFPAGGRTLLILLVADGADAEPPSHTARLDSWAPLGPLEFRLTAVRSGPLLIRFLVYDADRGTLLQESHLPPFDVAELAHQDVAV